MEKWARYWSNILSRASEKAAFEHARDLNALLAVGAMINGLEHRGRIPAPTPELNASLAWAEALAA